jgi:hypothetical protein
MKAVLIAQMQDSARKKIEKRNLAKTLASEKAYAQMMWENEEFKRTTKEKVDKKFKNFGKRMNERK